GARGHRRRTGCCASRSAHLSSTRTSGGGAARRRASCEACHIIACRCHSRQSITSTRGANVAARGLTAFARGACCRLRQYTSTLSREVGMANGAPVILGQNNTATKKTVVRNTAQGTGLQG